MGKKRAYILGYGKSGQAAAAYLAKEGHPITIIDKRAREIREKEALECLEEGEIGSFERGALFVKSPGIGWHHSLVIKAQEEGLELTSEIELGLLALFAKGKRLYAITGSNGKTTTTLLTAHILQASGMRAEPCGNVGIPILSCLDSEADIFIVELSSYQIEQLSKAVFSGAVILNISPNHLDHYEDLEAYKRAKFRLKELTLSGAPIFYGPTLDYRPQVLDFQERTFEREGRAIAWICPHDWENVRAAFSLSSLEGISESLFWQALPTFAKPAHRMEFVRKYHEINYINDSKATSFDAVEKAVSSLKCPVVLIAGGRHKGGDFREWSRFLGGHVKAILAIGEAGSLIREALGELIAVEEVKTLPRAIERASEIASPGECILFSPGCASFDQFMDFEDRGESFKKLVRELK